jgi:hypothetical protein
MKVFVGDHELTAVPMSLMTPDGQLIPGHTGKSELTRDVLNYCGEIPSDTFPTDSYICVVIDAMAVVNELVPKPSIKTGDDLATEFFNHVGDLIVNAEIVTELLGTVATKR